MIPFRDILKEAYGKMTQESDFIDADFVGTEGEISSNDDLKEGSEEEKIEAVKPTPSSANKNFKMRELTEEERRKYKFKQTNQQETVLHFRNPCK